MVELAYLGVVVNVFISNQWEREEMHKDVYSYIKCNIGLEAIALLSALRISL
jgi:hypothetical protein